MKVRLRLAIGCLVLFGLTTVWVFTGYSTTVEAAFYSLLSVYRSPLMNQIVKTITNLGGFFTVLCGTLFLLAFRQTRREYGIPVGLTLLLAAMANILLKVIFMRERPDLLRLIEETGYSFPSGHSMNGMAFYAALALQLWSRKPGWKSHLAILCATALVTFLIGLSRIYLGVHFVGDVLAGWFLGFAIVMLVDMVDIGKPAILRIRDGGA